MLENLQNAKMSPTPEEAKAIAYLLKESATAKSEIRNLRRELLQRPDTGFPDVASKEAIGHWQALYNFCQAGLRGHFKTMIEEGRLTGSVPETLQNPDPASLS